MTQPLATAPWGPWIGAYIILTGLASGLTLITRFVRPTDERTANRLEWIASWGALACLAACLVILVADLGRPSRFFLMVTQLENVGSLMGWGAKLIAAKVGLLVVYLYLLHRRRHALAVGDLAITGRATRALYAGVPDMLAIASFALAIYPAFLLSWTWSSPAAHNAGSALVYLSSGALLGAAAVNLIAAGVPQVSDPAMDEAARRSVARLLAAHLIVLGFVALSLRANETRRVSDALWHGTWAGAAQLMLVATGAAVVLSLPLFTTRVRVPLSIAALVGAATCRYLVFAAH